jgi:hypothetical protein
MGQMAHEEMENALIRTFTVGTAVTKGKLVKFAGDDTVTDASAGELGMGIAMETSSTAGARVQVALLSGASIVKVLVGTGGATRGKFATAVANGLTDITPGGGTVAKYIAGLFLQTGAAGEYVGMLPMVMPTTTA